MKIFALTGVAMLSLIGITHVQADDARAPNVVVKYNHLDLDATLGQGALWTRINRAARMVCASLDPSLSVDPSAAAPVYKNCLRDAVSNAVMKVNEPSFTAYAAEKASTAPVKLVSR